MIRDIATHRRYILSYVHVPVNLTIWGQKNQISDQMNKIRKKKCTDLHPIEKSPFPKEKNVKVLLLTNYRSENSLCYIFPT